MFLGNMRCGSIPTEAEKVATQERTANTFGAVAAQLLAQYARKLASGPAERERRLLKTDLAPIGNIAIAEVTAPILLRALRKIEHRGAVETAHLARMLASLVFRYAIAIAIAIATGRADRNPRLHPRLSLPCSARSVVRSIRPVLPRRLA